MHNLHPRWPSIGFAFVQLFHAPGHSLRRDADPSCQLSLLRSIVRTNSWSGGSISRIVTGRAVHRLEYAYKIPPLNGSSLSSALRRASGVSAQNHCPESLAGVLRSSRDAGEVLKEHMFRAD